MTDNANITLYSTELLVLQLSTMCNISCSYCYLPLSGSVDLPGRNQKGMMDISIAKMSVERVLERKKQPPVFTISLHAGEPLLAGKKFFAEFGDFIVKLNNEGASIGLDLQTNGILLDEEWCTLLREYDFSVGVSIDGPKALHDFARRDRRGLGTFEKVMNGLTLLRENAVPFHVICVLTSSSLNHADKIYPFLNSLGPTNISFNIDEADGINETSTVMKLSEDAWKSIYSQIFKSWLFDKKRTNVRDFSAVFSAGREESLDSLGNNTNQALRIVSVSSKGFFSTFSPELLNLTHLNRNFVYGHIMTDQLDDVIDNKKFVEDWYSIQDGVNRCKTSCSYFAFCHGGHPSSKLSELGTFSGTRTKQCSRIRINAVDAINDSLKEVVTWEK